ncbi:hypothetical protein FA15DRAFT_247051 [Coprinopsis marcescibilis]|uniref:Uncharacterized protein n=1 Tax=Coprinopsis marcescibilis TaxID=230819 RepID=A0A5C3L2M1_COPMA|nr:hypothetical protein FA15DRAFT_247051 [Coprinopsis marcescibilis]
MPRIDDTSSEIVYSTGQWQTSQGDSRQYQGTSHFTTVVNAEATIDFRGTRIRVYGTNPGSGGTIEAFFTLDNVEILWRKTSDGRAQDMFWESPTLTNSPHTLIVRNSGGSQVPFHLDFFDIEVPGSPATEPPNTPDTPNTPNEPTPPLPLNSPVSTPRADPSRTDLPTVNPPAQTPSTGQDSPDLPIISQAPTNDRDSSNNSNGGSITVTEVSTQVKPVPIFETNESSKGNISGTKGGLETGAIVGITIGALALILLLGIFVLLLKRRRKRLDKEARGSSDLVYQAGPGTSLV